MKIYKGVIENLPFGGKVEIDPRPEGDDSKNQEGWAKQARSQRAVIKGLSCLGHSDSTPPQSMERDSLFSNLWSGEQDRRTVHDRQAVEWGLTTLIDCTIEDRSKWAAVKCP